MLNPFAINLIMCYIYWQNVIFSIYEKGNNMSYVDDSLVPGETVLYRATISWACLIWPVVLLAFLVWLASKIHPLVVLIILVFAVFVITRFILAILSTEFALTNQRIIAKRGIIRHQSIEIMLSKVESVLISQSLDGRIFRFGTVTVVGSGGTDESFKSISHPLELRKRVNEQISTNTK
jgi:uncharacterized membrane protein YdbT with pleckstrin-like domain